MILSGDEIVTKLIQSTGLLWVASEHENSHFWIRTDGIINQIGFCISRNYRIFISGQNKYLADGIFDIGNKFDDDQYDCWYHLNLSDDEKLEYILVYFS